ncbi:MAG: sensor histidine kinase [Saprospirales bacterium]|nr:MAG: sensor histidine kinase [Saprospirales bacterium]
MNRVGIWTIIILMSTGVVGSFFIQLYWINYSLELNESKFDQNIFSALSNVAAQIERMDEIRQSTELLNLYGQKVNIDWDEVARSPFSSHDYSFTVRILEQLFELDSISLLNHNLLMEGGALSSVILQQTKGKPELAERIDPAILDQVLEVEMENRNLRAKYEYGVLSLDDRAIVIENGRFAVNVSDFEASVVEIDDLELNPLVNSRYRVRLFTSPEGSQGELIIHFPDRSRFIWEDAWVTLFGSLIFTALILFCFGYTIFVIFRQKRLSEMKNDFINNMTHEFKTPIATISLAADSINSPSISQKPEKVLRFAGIIKQENQRMLNQVEKVLQMALIDKRRFSLRPVEVDLHEMIEKCIKHFAFLVHKKEGSILTSLNARNPIVIGDKMHIENILNNLLDNAYKYSPDHPEIKVRTQDTEDGVEIRVSDNGIGLSAEARRNIFDKFYRVHTGNLHDVKGFGLGLTYVKAMMTAHKGEIDVESSLGKGSTFILRFPRNFQAD